MELFAATALEVVDTAESSRAFSQENFIGRTSDQFLSF